MRMEDGRDDKPQETERRNALPWQLAVMVFPRSVSVLHELPYVLEQLSHLPIISAKYLCSARQPHI